MIIVIAGPTAVGKTKLSIELAKKYNAEIINYDSVQIYKEMDIASAKVTKEEAEGIPHHLIDIKNYDQDYSVYDYQIDARNKIKELEEKGKNIIMVGGTGLYVNSVVDGYNLTKTDPDPRTREKVLQASSEELIEIIKESQPEALKTLDLNNKRRLERAAEKVLNGEEIVATNSPHYETLLIGVTWPREVLYERIRERLDKRLEEGMIDEVKKLRENGATDDFLYKLGLEYRYILMYLRGEFKDFDAFYETLFTEIRHLAKEQMTWFRKRNDIHWIDMRKDPFNEACELIDKFYSE